MANATFNDTFDINQAIAQITKLNVFIYYKPNHLLSPMPIQIGKAKYFLVSQKKKIIIQFAHFINKIPHLSRKKKQNHTNLTNYITISSIQQQKILKERMHRKQTKTNKNKYDNCEQTKQ